MGEDTGEKMGGLVNVCKKLEVFLGDKDPFSLKDSPAPFGGLLKKLTRDETEDGGVPVC